MGRNDLLYKPLSTWRLLLVLLHSADRGETREAYLQVDGLMTIAPLSDDPDVAVRTFTNLRTIRDELAATFSVPLRELSMGMSGDMSVAIAAGSTQVRVGTALFGARD